MLTAVSIARCSAEIMKATAIPKFTSLATILHIFRLWGHIFGPSVLFRPLFGDPPLDFEVRDLFDWTGGQQNPLSITAQFARNNSSGD